MSIKAVIEYKGQDHNVWTSEFKENTLREAINAIKEVQKKSEEFLTTMLSEEAKDEVSKKLKKDQIDQDQLSGGSGIEEEEPPRDDGDDNELLQNNGGQMVPENGDNA